MIDKACISCLITGPHADPVSAVFIAQSQEGSPISLIHFPMPRLRQMFAIVVPSMTWGDRPIPIWVHLPDSEGDKLREWLTDALGWGDDAATRTGGA